VEVEWRQTAAASDEYFEQMLAELQSGKANVDVIGSDVIWTAQFAANGYILDVSDRFPQPEREKYLPAQVESLLYEGRMYGVPWFTDAGMFYYRQDLLEKRDYSEPPCT
jgi:multiple sugar transport system substrate-binding protein